MRQWRATNKSDRQTDWQDNTSRHVTHHQWWYRGRGTGCLVRYQKYDSPYKSDFEWYNTTPPVLWFSYVKNHHSCKQTNEKTELSVADNKKNGKLLARVLFLVAEGFEYLTRTSKMETQWCERWTRTTNHQPIICQRRPDRVDATQSPLP